MLDCIVRGAVVNKLPVALFESMAIREYSHQGLCDIRDRQISVLKYLESEAQNLGDAILLVHVRKHGSHLQERIWKDCRIEVDSGRTHNI